MKLIVLNSNSKGNSYLLEADNGETLIVECGVAFKTVKEALCFDLSKVVGCIVSHEHRDHCKALPAVVKAGINVYTSKGTKEALPEAWQHRRVIPVEARSIIEIKSFKIIPFDVKHDCAEPFGFLIRHDECGTVLFITDSYYVPFKFGGLNNVLIEANYSEAILAERSLNQTIHPYVEGRVRDSHLSLETCLSVLRGNDLREVNNIVLLHLSDGNSDAKLFRDTVAKATGKTVTVADKGLVVTLNKTPF